MNFKRKLLIFLISFSFIIPINVLAYAKYLVPGGENIGIKVESEGVFVVGFYKVSNENIAEKAGFKLGDRIISINDYSINSVNDLVTKITSNEESLNIKFGFIRDDKLRFLNMTLKKDKLGAYKTGLYVKDSIVGIGTLTYIDPETNTYGALGHEIIESNSGKMFATKKGLIFDSQITSITKASIGKPGEKNAKINYQNIYGDIDYNIETGIFGSLRSSISDEELLQVASLDEVEIGKAEIITVLSDNKKEVFNIEILSIDKTNTTKNFLIKITDDNLIQKTGGIVKGMSGSPIIQNGKIIGAITHTIVDNPNKGYGIGITKMLESIE